MDGILTGTFFLAICHLLNVVSATDTCSGLPPSPIDGLTFVGGSELVNGEYLNGAKAVYKCDDDGFGYVSLACLGNNEWGKPSRSCADDLDFGVGSIVGVSVFGLAVLIVIMSLIGSTIAPKEKPATAV